MGRLFSLGPQIQILLGEHMSLTNALESSPSKIKGRKPLWFAIVVVVVWLGISSVAGPLFGQLSTVQKNDNSKFLPDSAESTKVAALSSQFQAGASDRLPALVLFIGKVDASKIAAANTFLQGLGSRNLVDSKGHLLKDAAGRSVQLPIGQYLTANSPVFAFPAQKNDAILANIPIKSKESTALLPDQKPALIGIITSIRYYAAQFAASLGYGVHVTGTAAIFADLFGAFGSIDSSLLLTTGLVVGIILIIVYRSPFLWILPLLSALIALSLAGAVIYQLAKHDIIALDGQSQGILSVLVLGAATDYALLLIARYREELHLHESRFDAMKIAWRGVVEPIIASGSTVTIGLLVLLLSELTNNRGLGPVGAIGIICSMITILTFLPAVLVLFGRWIFWPKSPRFGSADEKLSGVWAKVANATSRKPRKYLLATALLLIIMAGFSTTLHATGISATQVFTKNPDSVVGLKKLLNYFPGGSGQPTQVIVSQIEVGVVSAELKSIPGISDVSPAFVSEPIPGQALPAVKVVAGKVMLNVVLAMAPDSAKAKALIPIIRSAMHKIDSSIVTGGSTAVSYDISVAATHDRNLIIPVILLVIALILSMLLRSILAAGMLLATVVLSFLATLGVCALVFHHLFHFSGEDTAFPLFAFVFLVALGIDYNIFLMTRVREETKKFGTRAGVTKGVTVTGGVITSAGIVLAATFTVLGILPLVFLAELGFAVGFGVLLDTLIVRSILVPAIVHVIGPKVWWPSKLQNESKKELQEFPQLLD
jgi:RND superfamily putative drug exporter